MSNLKVLSNKDKDLEQQTYLEGIEIGKQLALEYWKALGILVGFARGLNFFPKE